MNDAETAQVSFWVYVLKCADGLYYTGHTDNLEHRIAQHYSGAMGGFTSHRRPVQLEWTQEFPSRLEAIETELRVKKWSRAKKEALFSSEWDALSQLSRPPTERNSVSTSLDTNGKIRT